MYEVDWASIQIKVLLDCLLLGMCIITATTATISGSVEGPHTPEYTEFHYWEVNIEGHGADQCGANITKPGCIEITISTFNIQSLFSQVCIYYQQ